MSDKYKIYDKDKAYFVTITVVGWIDIFTRYNHKLKIVESLTYCQQNKGLTILGWCLILLERTCCPVVKIIANAAGADMPVCRRKEYRSRMMLVTLIVFKYVQIKYLYL